jgi:hypothetical protein
MTALMQKWFEGNSATMEKEVMFATGRNPKEDSRPEFIKRRNEKSEEVRIKERRRQEDDMLLFVNLVNKANTERKEEECREERGRRRSLSLDYFRR